MQISTRMTALALAAATAAIPAIADATAKPAPPTKATIVKQFTTSYCSPIENLNGDVVSIAKVTLKSVKIAAPRLGRYLADGTPPNKKTYVFPVRAVTFCDYSATAQANPGSAPSDRRISGDYVFFRDEFGAWTHRNKGHKVVFISGS